MEKHIAIFKDNYDIVAVDVDMIHSIEAQDYNVIIHVNFANTSCHYTFHTKSLEERNELCKNFIQIWKECYSEKDNNSNEFFN